MTISDSNAAATGGKAAAYSCGIYNSIDIEIIGGTVTATGGESMLSHGIYNEYSLEISDATVNAAGNNAASESHGIYFNPQEGSTSGEFTVTSGTINSGLTITAGGNAVFNDVTFCGTITNHGKSEINGGSFGGSIINEGQLTINGGRFSTDPTKTENGTATDPNVIIPEDKEIIFTDDNTYPYQLIAKATGAEIKNIYGNSIHITGVDGQEYIIVPKGKVPTEDDWSWENDMKIRDITHN